MQSLYTTVKVHNEIELCEVNDIECKQVIERALLKNRISYYIRWPKSGIFHRRKNLCVICVNDNARDEAENIVRDLCDEAGYHVRFVMRKLQNDYL